MKIISDDRGNSLVSAMVGAIVGIMLLALIAGGLNVFMNFYLNVGSANAVTAQKSHVDQQFRADVALASNISAETATASSFTVITPSGADGKCTESSWTFSDANGKKQLVRTARKFAETIPPQTNAVATASSVAGSSSCGGALLHEHTETMLNDAGSSALFAYANVAGVPLEKDGQQMKPSAEPTASTLATRSLQDSQRIAGVTLKAAAAASGNKSSPITVVQYAKNLEAKSVSLKSYRVDHMNLGGS